MNRQTKTILLFLTGLLATFPASLHAKKPNIILIFTDDQGYNDLGCFGSEKIKTPRLDKMAEEGLKLTNFYAQPVCGVSRAALMTGCYPIRTGEPGNVKRLHTELHTKEVTMAEVLKGAGYATAIIGKWHLGNVMPNDQGFDYFFGTPKFNGFTVYVEDTKFRSQLLRNKEVVVPAIQSWDNITQDYTKESLEWIEKHKDKPFFLYLAHNLPHIPVGASKDFKGKSEYGPYGDTIEEIDWSTGKILDKLKELGIDDNTLVIFTSDNGPWIETTAGMKPGGRKFIPADHSGLADPLRGWKMSAWEGGSRVPFLARWPGKIEAGSESKGILTTMDLLPTFAKLAGAKLPDIKLDGTDAADFLAGKAEGSPRDEYLYYTGCLLTGIRKDNWRLVLPRPANPPGTGWWGRMIEAIPAIQLYDLENDPGESKDVAKDHPEVVKQLLARVEEVREDLGDIDKTGSGARFFEPGPRKLQVALRKGKPAPKGKPAAGQYDGFPPLGDFRFNFESGDAQGWVVTEGNLSNPVSPLPALPQWKHKPYHKEGKFHLSTIYTGSGVSDQQTGVLESPRFKLAGKEAAFLASGGFDDKQLYIGLFDAESGKRLLAAGGPKGPQMHRVKWDVSKWVGKTVFLRIVDQRPSNWGHLTFDDFSTQAEFVSAVPKVSPKPTAPAKPQSFGEQRSESGIRHSFLITGTHTLIVSEENEIVWESKGRSRDGFVLENGNVLISQGNVAKELTRQGKLVWSYKLRHGNKELGTAQRLPNGNTLIVERGAKPQLLEVAPDGSIKVKVPLQPDTNNAHMQTRMARKLPNGNYIVPHLLAFAVKEYQPDGKVIKAFKTDTPTFGGEKAHAWPFTAIRLTNGNTLVNLTHGNQSVEFGPNGQIAWHLTNQDVGGRLADPCGGQRLANGNTVICSYGQKKGDMPKLLEVTPCKKVVWEYFNPAVRAHEVHILTTNGKPEGGIK